MRSLLFAAFLFAGVASAPAFAEDEVPLSTLPPCDGNPSIFRISAIKHSGSMEGFLKALEAHKDWYRSHGYKDNEIYPSKVLVQDRGSKKWKYSDREIMVVHVRPPQDVKRDAAWHAYVKQYSDNSEIKSEYFACVPKQR